MNIDNILKENNVISLKPGPPAMYIGKSEDLKDTVYSEILRLSLDMAVIKTKKPKELYSSIFIRFFIPRIIDGKILQAQEIIKCEAIVSNLELVNNKANKEDRLYGMGVQFQDIKAKDQDKISKFLNIIQSKNSIGKKDKRKYHRVNVNIPVMLRENSIISKDHLYPEIVNISLHGSLIKSTNNISVNDDLGLSFFIPNNINDSDSNSKNDSLTSLIYCNAIIIRKEGVGDLLNLKDYKFKYGFGLKFIDISTTIVKKLEKFINHSASYNY